MRVEQANLIIEFDNTSTYYIQTRTNELQDQYQLREQKKWIGDKRWSRGSVPSSHARGKRFEP